MKRTLSHALLVLSLLPGCDKPAPAPPKSKPPVILVFADVTDSLLTEERQVVHNAIHDIFDRAPEKSTIRVYPVVAVMDVAPPLINATIPFRTTTGAHAIKQAADHRAALARRAVAALVEVERKVDPRVPSSCLSGALRRAANDILDLEERPVDVVIISDMVEDCSHSIHGGRVALVRAGIRTEITAAMKLPSPYADLRKANVFFIYPAAVNSGLDLRRRSAPPQELQAFWTAVLSRCNAGRLRFVPGPGLYRATEWTRGSVP
jgi:hypothetical protein